MNTLPTGSSTIDALSSAAARHLSVVQNATEQRNFFLFSTLMAAETQTGVTLTKVPATQASDVLVANTELLALLHYPDLPTYAAARVAPGFVHADDKALLDEHVQNGNSATFDARFKRGDNGNYVRLRSQGLTFSLEGPTFRLALVRGV